MEKRGNFSNSVGFILAAAGSAVGLGNIWRFPYLAAKDGGGLFLLIYVILVATFGYTLLVTEISIGRKTKQSQLTAYSNLNKFFGWLGGVSIIVPFLILPYYCVIGGWVLKYFFAFLTGQGEMAAGNNYFNDFLSNPLSSIVFTLIFLLATILIVYLGVKSGIERMSKILMPILVIMVIAIAVFSVSLKGTDPNGNFRTGLDGLRVYLIPDLSKLTIKSLATTIIDATTQLFYSISVAMGIMIAYGSYVSDDTNLMKSVNRIEIFDSAIAVLAGIMIIPAVLVFMGEEGMKASGPGLMFIAIPKVFQKIEGFGSIVGAMFFFMVFMAALSSSVSILEAIVSGLIDKYKIERKKAVIGEGLIASLIAIVVCLGYNLLYLEIPFPNGSKGQILDLLDFASNSIFMPIVAIGTCILIGWVLKPKVVIDEATKNGEKFSRKNLYIVMIKFVAPILLILLLLVSLGIIEL